MTARVIIVPGAMPSRDANGRALPAKLRFYSPGTTTPAAVFTDNTLTVPLAFPILSDSAGRFPAIWADDSNTFDVAWSDQTFDATIDTFTGLSPAADATLASVALAQAAADAAAASAAQALGAPGTPIAKSASSATIGTGTFIFALTVTGKLVPKGQRILIASDANPPNQLSGIVTNFADPNITVVVDTTAGSGTHTDWDISFTGGGAVSSVAGLSGAITGANLKTATSLDQVQNHPVAGRQAIWVPASAMTPRFTNGAAPGLVETATNKIMGATLDFDASTRQFAQFSIRMPKAWDLGTVTAVFEWSHAATSTNFAAAWALQAVAISDHDAGDAAFGTAQQANDVGGTTDMFYASPETAAITVAGTPAAEDVVIFQAYRVADDATNDTLAINGRLRGVTVYINTATGTDA